jgi:hypothetical protein
MVLFCDSGMFLCQHFEVFLLRSSDYPSRRVPPPQSNSDKDFMNATGRVAIYMKTIGILAALSAPIF